MLLTSAEEKAAREAGLAARANESAKPTAAPEKPSDVAGTVRAFGEGALAGAIDVAMSPVALAAAGVEALAPEGSSVEDFAARAREAASGRAMMGSVVGMTAGEESRAEYEAAARAAAEEHGFASGAGELVGGIAGLAATGGLGGLAKGAQKGAAKLVGAGLGGRLAGAAARGVVEGAAFGTGAVQDEAWVASRRLTGQQVLATAGMSGLLGGALSFGVEGLGELLAAGRSKAAAKLGASAAEGATREAVPESIAGVVEGGGEAAAEASLGERVAAKAKPILQEITKTDDAAIRQAGKAALGEEMGERVPEFYRDVVRGKDIRPGIVSEASSKLASDADTVMRSTDAIADEMVNRAAKLEHVAENFRKVPAPEGAIAKAKDASLALWDEVRKVEETVASQVKGGKLGELTHLRDELARGVKSVQTAENPAEAYMAIDQMRRNMLRSLDSIGLSAQRTADPTLVRVYTDAAQALRGTYDKAANHLFDTSVWGAQGAAQKEVNEAWVQFINARKYAFGDIARQEGEKLLPTGMKVPTFRIQEGKVSSIVDRFGTPAGRDAMRSFDQYVSAAERLASAIGKGYELAGTKSEALTALQKSVANIRGTLDAVSKDTKSLSQAEALFRGGEHSLIGGLMGRAADVAGVSGPAAAMRARVTLEVNANRAAKQIAQAIDYIFEPAAKKAATTTTREAAVEASAASPGMARRALVASTSAARRVPAGSAMAHFLGRASTPEAAYERRRDEIIAANANNAEQVRNAVADSLGPLGRADPHAMASMVTSATKVAQYLQSQMPVAPKSPSFTPLTDAQRTPSRAEIQNFAELYEAVDKPLQTLSKLSRGTVSRDQVRAIAACYPDMYEAIRTETLRRLRESDEQGQEIPYRQRVILDGLLDLQGQADRTLQPDFALQYGSGMVGNAPQASDSAPAPKPRQSTIASRFATGTTTMLGGKS